MRRQYASRTLQVESTGLGQEQRFGTRHACFSTASVSRPSAGATVGLLSAQRREARGRQSVDERV
jgi:hypothetical protein